MSIAFEDLKQKRIQDDIKLLERSLEIIPNISLDKNLGISYSSVKDESLVGLFKLSTGRIMKINSINGDQLKMNEDVFKLLTDAWQKAIESDTLEF